MGPHFHSTFIITGKILLIARIYFTYKPPVLKRLERKTKTILFATPLLATPPLLFDGDRWRVRDKIREPISDIGTLFLIP